ncbi:MAG TPA: VTT domain-containing protein [Gaiellaceae bacterium]|nr:VTT domain-containing protein [Gaiellaceae bacterium]
MEALYDLLAQPPVAYLVLFGIVAGDAVFPAFPSESAAIFAGVLAAIEPEIALPAVLGVAAAGAFSGDSVSYALGRFGGRPAQRRFFDGPYARRAVRWSCDQLRLRGGLILVVARFVPGGRTGATFTSGLTGFRYLTFAFFTAIAAAFWALYAVLLGYFGGRIFHERPLLAVGVAFALAAGVAAAVEITRRFLRRS